MVDAAGVANTAIVDPDKDKGEASTTIPEADVEWQWSKSSSRTGTYADITGDDAAKTIIYTPASQDRGMYLRITATYDDGEGEDKTVVATSRYPVRAFPSGNSAPAFPTDFGPDPNDENVTLTAPMAEADDGATEGDNVGDPVEANDANNDRLTYSLEAVTGEAADADVFQIDRMTGQVTVGLGKTVNPNSDSTNEADTETRNDDEFTVTIKATDPSGLPDMVVMTITVDEVDEAPAFTAGKASHSHAENDPAAEVVYTFVASDPENDTVTYSVSGDDDGKFTIGPSNGELTFDASPNFEARGSADGDNVYEVTVKATSNAGGDATDKSTTVDVTVEVTNVDEDGSVTLSASQPRIGIEIRANTPTDPDGGVTGVTWQWERADAAEFGDGDNVTEIEDATMAGYTPVAADDEKFLRVTATYTDAEGSGKTAVGTPNLAGTAQSVEKVRNLAPVFTDEDDDTAGLQIDPREVAEDAAAGDDVGDPVVATDAADADTSDDRSIFYSLSGPDASSFTIEDPNSDSGAQIQVGANAKLDHETNPAYEVTVTARDPEGLNSSVDVTIKVTDVDEAPEISGSSSEMFVENGDGVVAVFTAVDPEMKSVTWSMVATDPGGTDLDSGDFTNSDLFDISAAGELTFMDEPDFEAPAGGTGSSNTYQLVVAASDGVVTGYKAVEVEVTNEEETATTGIELSSLQPQVSTAITVDYVDGVGNPLVDAAGVANTAIVDPDKDKGEASTTIPEADVEWQWSKSSSRTGTYADITGDDAAKTIIYTPASQDRGMYLRITATYDDGEGEDKTVVATSRYPVRAFPSGNSAPAFPEDFDPDPDVTQASPMAEADDGATEGDNVGDPVEANDANNDRLTYSLEAVTGEAADADVFQIDRMTGQVTVGLGKTVNPNSDSTNEADTETRNDDEFTVTIKATDPSGLPDMVVMTITVDEVDEAPAFTAGKASHSHAENDPAAEVVYTFVASDPENDTVTYSVSGDDDGKFTIGPSNGELTFDASPNFEARGSADGDNVYEVTVKATSNAGGDATDKSTTVDVTVEVTNVDEDGSVTLSASQPRIGIEIRANTPTDPDGGVTGVTWQWERADAAEFGDGDNVTEIEDATMAGYTPVAADDEKFLRVTATYTDAEGSGKTAVGTPNLAGTAQSVEKVRNLAPVFTDEDDDTAGLQIDPREVAEDAAAGDDVGDPVVATDAADADTSDDRSIFYSLSGPDASSFTIEDPNSDSGAQIQVGANAKLDHETNPAYEVTVTARDPEGLSTSVDVTIKVTDVDEAPVITVGGLAISGRGSVDYAEDRTDAVATYTASGPDAASASWSLSGDDAGVFSISSAGVLTFDSSPDFDTPGDADGDNVYAVTVNAADGTYTDTHDVTITVTAVDDEVVQPGETLLERYDKNENGRIDKEELAEAIFDYNINKTLEKEDLVNLIFSYEIG